MNTPTGRTRIVSRNEGRLNSLLKTPSSIPLENHTINSILSSSTSKNSRTFDESTTLFSLHRSSSRGNISQVIEIEQDHIDSLESMCCKLPVNEVNIDRFFELQIQEQEDLLLNDLLNLLLGIDGTYLRIQVSKKGIFSLNADFAMDDSLREFVKLITPCILHFWTILKFIEEKSKFEYGVVNHALAASLRDILKDYHVVVGQIEQRFYESQCFTIQQFWYLLQPNSETIRLLSQLCNKIDQPNLALISPRKPNSPIEGIRGGQVIQVVHQEQMKNSGNPKSKLLYQHILEKISEPYLKMTRCWIYRGEISDPFDEFMIQEKQGLSKEQIKDDFSDVYWDQRYSLRSEYVPPYLSALKEKVLLAGKYLNVVRECDFDLISDSNPTFENQKDALHNESSSLTSLTEALKDQRLQKEIEGAYKTANQKLLEVIFKKYNLEDRLKSMKRYFLMDQSDFMVAFLDCAVGELEKPAKLISLEHLRTLMELVLRNPSSVSANDPYKDEITVELSKVSLFDQLIKITTQSGFTAADLLKKNNPDTLFSSSLSSSSSSILHGLNSTEQSSSINPSITALSGKAGDADPLKGIDAISLGYTLKYPLSLILNKKIMTKYQILFRYLVLCKYLESKLTNCWKMLSSSRLNIMKMKNAEIIKGPSSSNFIGSLCLTNAKMLGFIQQLLYFSTFEIIEPHWTKMMNDLVKAATVDQVLELHNDFLDTCLKECMLTNTKLIKLFQQMMTICLSFVKFTGASMQLLSTDSLPIASEAASNIAQLELQDVFGQQINFWSGVGHGEFSLHHKHMDQEKTPEKILDTIQDNFVNAMNVMLESLQFHGATETAVFSDLASRLDSGHYYARQSMLRKQSSSALSLKNEAKTKATYPRKYFEKNKQDKEVSQEKSQPKDFEEPNLLLETMDLNDMSMDLRDV